MVQPDNHDIIHHDIIHGSLIQLVTFKIIFLWVFLRLCIWVVLNNFKLIVNIQYPIPLVLILTSALYISHLVSMDMISMIGKIDYMKIEEFLHHLMR